MRNCGHFLIKAEGGAKNYERDHPLPLAWQPFSVVLVQRKGYTSSQHSSRRVNRSFSSIRPVLVSISENSLQTDKNLIKVN